MAVIKKITIPTVVRDYWQQYGSLSDVVDRLLTEVDLLTLPSMDLDSYDSTVTTTITVTNEDYIDMSAYISPQSNRMSIGRLLTYLYTVGHAEERGWTIITPDVNIRRHTYRQVLRQLTTLLYTSKNDVVSDQLQTSIAHITHTMREDINNA